VLKAFLPALAIFAMECAAFDATPAKTHKRQHSTTSSSGAPAKKSTKATAANAPPVKTTKGKTTKTVAHRKGKTSRRPSRSYQQAPTPDRYKEIQQALASKGYLQGEPTGQWGPDSVDALKRFQTTQNLTPDGKINSLSLIALGLGPKHLAAKSEAPSPPAPPQ
jgi:peptidoglycan hydrolase-like protein with peptidoglycan-binding domain